MNWPSMKHFLKWMRDREKSLNSIFGPLYSWIDFRQNIARWTKRDDGDVNDALVTAMGQYADFNYPSIIMEGRVKDSLSLVTPNKPYDKILEDFGILLGNFFSAPCLMEDVLWVANDQDALSSALVEDVGKIIEQYASTITPVVNTGRWGLKSMMTYFFMRHSHKIQLTSILQNVLEKTTISDDVDISENFELPYPMNYIEYSEPIEYTPSPDDVYKITGALLYKIKTKQSVTKDTTNGPVGTYKWRIEDFPRETLATEGTIHGIVPMTNMTENKTNVSIDKAYFPRHILRMEDGAIIKPLGMELGTERTFTGGVSLENHDNGWHIGHEDRTTVSALLTNTYDAMLNEALVRMEYLTKKIGVSNDLPVKLAMHHDGQINPKRPDPYYHKEWGMDVQVPKDEEYFVIELLVDNGVSSGLFSDVGPYIEIGRREGGDPWSSVLADLEHDVLNKKVLLDAFKIAIQSIWFINEPDVKLVEPKPRKETAYNRKYHPVAEVKNRRKIILRGETSKYIATLKASIGSSPKGTFWVRGHWRNQWYRSLEEHKRKWIKPYVKGKGTKPAVKKQVDLDPEY